jgi:MFS family permease
VKRNRIAVIFFFFVNGFLHANLMARLPELQRSLSISNSILGSLLFSSALGALVAMPVAGWLSNKLGSDTVAKITAILFCMAIPFVAAFQIIWAVAFCFFMLGISTGSMDVSMNGQAVFVERKYNKPIMSSFHACFSIGMAVGAGAGAVFSAFKIDLLYHLISVGAIALIIITGASSQLIKETAISVKENKQQGFLNIIKLILPIGLIAFCGMITEGSMADWSAIYMNKVIGKNLVVSAFAFGIFATGMTTGRLLGDFLTLKLGRSKLLTIDAIAAILGLSLVLGFNFWLASFLGFLLVGLAVSTIVPIVFSAAGNTKGVNPSVGIAAATSIGYLGFFVGPPAIGFLADRYGLRMGLCFTLCLLFVMLFLIIGYFRNRPI